MHRLFKSLLIVFLVLLVPVVPFLWFADSIDAWLTRWAAGPRNSAVTAAVIVGLLSTDVLLPIPSSLTSTAGGSQLGPIGGTLASWLGMSLGAALGFGLARRWGRPVAVLLASAEDLDRMDGLAQRYATTLLVVTRALPILAEASVLLAGIHRVAWRTFWLPVLFSNFVIALVYSVLGHVAEQNDWLPAALAVSLAAASIGRLRAVVAAEEGRVNAVVGQAVYLPTQCYNRLVAE